MTHKEYNGWYNYETWVVKLWIDNEEGSYNYWREMTEEAIKSCTKDTAIRNIEDALKQEHEDSLPELQGFAADLLNAAMSEVNWREIAESMVEDMLSDHPELIASEEE